MFLITKFLSDLDTNCENLEKCYLDCNGGRCACDYIRIKDIVCKRMHPLQC